MSDKFKNKNMQIVNKNKRKREKFIKPLITDDDFKDDSDVFFSVVKNKEKKNVEPINQSTYFLSPMRGKVEDRSTFPVTNSKGRIGKQYDFLRDDKKLKQDELKKQFGHEYYEFNLLNKPPQNKEVSIPMPQMKRKVVNEEILPKNKYIEPVREEVKEFNEINEINKINIIYEEEMDIESIDNIVTSYDNENNAAFFKDYHHEKPAEKPDENPSVNVFEYPNERKGLRDELKKLFSEDEYSPPKNPFYEENFSYDNNRHHQPEVKPETPEPKKDNVTFVNMKKEINQELEKIQKKPQERKEDYTNLDHYDLPSSDLLKEGTTFIQDDSDWIEDQMDILDQTLESFGVGAKTVNYSQGPSVIRYEIEPEPGIKVSRITALQDDIKLRLAASDIRIEAPISGKSTIGVEVPNRENRVVMLREILDSHSYKKMKSPLKIALGLDITGEPVFSDISSMTHSLIAGSTGSGKSVCINTIIVSILYNAMPDEVKLVLIDPKKVEFSMYRDIPHLLTPVINDSKVATATLRWLTEEMDRRYELIESVGARDIKSYNIKRNRNQNDVPKLPYIVVIIDELADLMMIAASEVEDYIQRLSQLARAAGIHLIVATQRPSTNVITGTIKTNIPTRISFKVASAIDSRIILDEGGAEKLLGKGDMLFLENGKPHLERLQGAYISDDEIEQVTNSLKEQLEPNYLFTSDDLVKKEDQSSPDFEDDLFDDAVRFVIGLREASASKIQRQFKVGYNRAARMIDMMEKYNIIGPQQGGSKPRDVLMTIDEYEDLINS